MPLKTIAYFNFDKITIKSNLMLQTLVEQNFPNAKLNSNTFDLLFVDVLDIPLFQKLISADKMNNDSLILVDSIYSNRKKKEEWDRLIALPEITVSIDMYYCGLISIRKEQVKEHFTIRI
ncbi:MAG: hypothetical protein GYB37_00335 [Algicola sp.]|nr:hypothetical protein [Algicola sp.]